MSSFDTTPKRALRIVAKKETKQTVEKEQLENIKHNKEVQIVGWISPDKIQESDA